MAPSDPALEPHEPWDQISRQIRTAMGLGRDKFARLLQVSPRTVMRWENGQANERVIPQGIQRMKLLALALDAAAPELRQQDLLASMLEQATELRAQYERKAVTIKCYELVLEDEPPAWFDDLLALKREGNWSALLRLGPHFLPPAEAPAAPLPGVVEALVCLWIGIAAFMQGLPQRAVQWCDRALAQQALPPLVRCVLLSNKALALIRGRGFAPAQAALEECLSLDPAHRGALRNRLILHAQADEPPAAMAAARELLRHYPEAGQPESELGRCLLEDPDLAGWRASAAFAEVFPGLAATLQTTTPAAAQPAAGQ